MLARVPEGLTRKVSDSIGISCIRRKEWKMKLRLASGGPARASGKRRVPVPIRLGLGVAALAAGISCFTQSKADAALIYGVTFDNNLFSFDSATPGNILSGVAISGLQPNEVVQAIDFRPSTNVLYGLGSTNRIYTLNLTSGAATAVSGTPFAPPALSGTAFGMDFNPVADLIRVHSNTQQNLRISPTTGLVVNTDPDLVYAAGDSGAGSDPNIVATAYSNNIAGATTTSLFSIDSVRDTLNTHSGSPGFAQMTTVGTLRNAAGATIPFADYSGFDISGASTAYVHWNNANALFGTVDLSIPGGGTVTTIGNIGGGFFVRDIAAVIPEPASVALLCAGLCTLVRRRGTR
jgi:hypothetical protein